MTMKMFSTTLAALLMLALTAAAQERARYPFRRPGAIRLKLELPLFPGPGEREFSSLAALPHYAGSDKSIAAEPRPVRTAAHLGNIGLAAAGAFVNPAFLLIAAYHIAGLVRENRNRKKPSERPAEVGFIWSRR